MPHPWTGAHIQFLTQPELRALFHVIARKRDRALFLVAYRHGLRASEVGLLQVEDLNLAQQRLTIRRLKRSLPGIYPLRADEVTALTAYLRERRHPALPPTARREMPCPVCARLVYSVPPPFRRLAEGRREDDAAVQAGVTRPWRQGPSEGPSNRLRRLKRRMCRRTRRDRPARPSLLAA